MSVRALCGNALAVLGLLAAPSCSDTKPLDYKGDLDAGSDSAVPQEAVTACKSCMKDDGAPCRSQYDQCASNEKCVQLIDCAVEDGCFLLPQLQQRIPCVGPCLRKLEISTGSDPAVVQGLPVNACTLQGAPCGSACVRE